MALFDQVMSAWESRAKSKTDEALAERAKKAHAPPRPPLETWMTSVLHDDLPELHSFVTGLRRDQDAVAADLTLPYSSGPVEGHVNRIK